MGIVVLAVLLLTPGDDLPKVSLWDKLEHGLAFGVLAFTGAVAFPARSSLLGFGLPCLGTLFEILQIFVPGGKLLSATPWPTPLALRLD